ncbi:MAG: tRNA pseudouridine(55) synthase TruB [Candidatus Paracaedibacteraceae bacterium]|nr:tRNA pseudouridine(55) synthase TruB [Candidatus Paracaedibacteraceae bacterium]
MTHGWIILDKPEGITSTKAGSIVKRLFKQKKLGHAGTLDPFASGILPLALGEATKVMPYVMSDTKEYEFEITFGEERDTGDLEGQTTMTCTTIPTANQIRSVLPQFTGQITQIPPKYSALKINGERAYDLARRGEVIEMKSRQVMIYELEFMKSYDNKAYLRVLCGTGTYVRTLGQDIARAVGSLGYLSILRRTKVGRFSLKDSVKLDILKNSDYINHVDDYVLPIRAVLDDIPAVSVCAQQAMYIRQGRSIDLLGFSGTVLVLENGIELALCEGDGKVLHPKRVFNL